MFLIILNCQTKSKTDHVQDNHSMQKNSLEAENSEVFSSEGKLNEIDDQERLNDAQEIQFEDYYHYPFSVTEQKYWLINNQQDMNELFSMIHRNVGGNRLSPIPTVQDNVSYIVIKPQLKTTNDVLIKKIHYKNGILLINLEEFNNPQIDSKSRVTPNILLKLNKIINITDAKYQY